MGPVFDRQFLRRWFHLPAFAVIALAATTAYVADRGLDTWKAWKVPAPEPRKLELTGEATIAHIPAQRITWGVELYATAPSEGGALTALTARQDQLVQQLVDAGIERSEISAEAPSTSETTEYLDDKPRDWVAGRRTISHTSSRVLRVDSHHIAAGVAAFRAVSLAAGDWLTELEPVECSAETTDELRHRVQDSAWADLERLEKRVRARSSGVSLRTVSAQPSNVYLQEGAGDACTEGLEASGSVTMTYELR